MSLDVSLWLTNEAAELTIEDFQFTNSKESQRDKSAGKVILIIFFDHQGFT